MSRPFRSFRRRALVWCLASVAAAGAGLGALAGAADAAAPGDPAGVTRAPIVAAVILVCMSGLVVGMSLGRRGRA